MRKNVKLEQKQFQLRQKFWIVVDRKIECTDTKPDAVEAVAPVLRACTSYEGVIGTPERYIGGQILERIAEITLTAKEVREQLKQMAHMSVGEVYDDCWTDEHKIVDSDNPILKSLYGVGLVSFES